MTIKLETFYFKIWMRKDVTTSRIPFQMETADMVSFILMITRVYRDRKINKFVVN